MSLLTVIRDAITLDPFDVCYNLSSERMGYLAAHSARLPRRGIRYGAVRLLIALIKRIRHDIAGPWFSLPENSLLFFMTTKNQEDALAPLMESVPIFPRTRMTDQEIPWGIVYLLALPFFGVLLVHYLSATGYRRMSMQNVFELYWQSYGCYLYFRFITRKGVLAVIMANDHWVIHRALLKAANDNGVPTVYVQHASVTADFPPLEFSYALLDGQDALEKYDTVGPSQTRVYLVGICKLDGHIQARKQLDATRRIGICINALDLDSRVEELCEALVETFTGEDLVLRPHPTDHRRAHWMQVANRFGMGFSDPSSQSPIDFLRTLALVVAGDSNILLEAALLDVHPVYYDFSLGGHDHYGFLEHGLVQRRYTEPAEISRSILQLCGSDAESLRLRIRRYCATAGTKYEGRSTEVSSELLASLLSVRQAPAGKWQRIAGTRNLEAYKLV